ncbi:hypothetical protein [Zhihengliuella flava]|uniref:Uncharacterized protein n=1 Tax=Zhihengliuella flava TaxID=1285193 RepID=A0A931DBI7_9MICC|nr:hypothetical protein [Zhihengliuella flava]MBG6085854.1 hypothetical protein [Zhihengliuella flava]
MTKKKPQAVVPAALTFSEASHRYRMDGKPVRGVTTLIGEGVPKGQLIPWAGKMAGQWVAEHRDVLPTMTDEELIGVCTKAWRDVRDSAGVTGTRVHDMAEQLATTGEVEADEDITGYIEGYAQFLDDWNITPVLMERPVGNREHWYAGKFDLFATSPFLAGGKLVQIDLKTSKGVYGETALQTAAYARAEFYIDESGEPHPLPQVHATYVAHVTPMDRDGEHARYEGRPLGTSLYQLAESPEQIDEHFQWFLAAAYTAKTKKDRDVLAREPLTHPNQIEKAA